MFEGWAATEGPMISQGNELLKYLNFVILFVEAGLFERHMVTRKSLQRLVTVAEEPDVKMALKLSSPEVSMNARFCWDIADIG